MCQLALVQTEIIFLSGIKIAKPLNYGSLDKEETCDSIISNNSFEIWVGNITKEITKKQFRQEKSSMKTKTSRRSGFTLIEIMIVVAIIGLLVAIAIPQFVLARNTAQKRTCIENLQLLKIGQDSYVRECTLTNGTVLSGIVIERLKTGKSCPAGGTYTINAVGENPSCSLLDQGHTLTK
ncbi:MAG: hypothetical protein US12_C0034G0005 [Parcubacteria group bacterium GW2011_GWA2_36_24]|nr:MAG: hypothetical protein US12_C0034G0005 [Parcubacteria group bacterium GW2011_GWA2_36_24]